MSPSRVPVSSHQGREGRAAAGEGLVLWAKPHPSVAALDNPARAPTLWGPRPPTSVPPARRWLTPTEAPEGRVTHQQEGALWRVAGLQRRRGRRQAGGGHLPPILRVPHFEESPLVHGDHQLQPRVGHQIHQSSRLCRARPDLRALATTTVALGRAHAAHRHLCSQPGARAQRPEARRARAVSSVGLGFGAPTPHSGQGRLRWGSDPRGPSALGLAPGALTSRRSQARAVPSEDTVQTTDLPRPSRRHSWAERAASSRMAPGREPHVARAPPKAKPRPGPGRVRPWADAKQGGFTRTTCVSCPAPPTADQPRGTHARPAPRRPRDRTRRQNPARRGPPSSGGFQLFLAETHGPVRLDGGQGAVGTPYLCGRPWLCRRSPRAARTPAGTPARLGRGSTVSTCARPALSGRRSAPSAADTAACKAEPAVGCPAGSVG